MRILNSFKLAFANIRVTVKSMVLRLILFFVAFGCIYVWFYSALKDFFTGDSWRGLCANLKDCFSAFKSGESGALYTQAISDSVASCFKTLMHEKGAVALALCGCVLIFCIFAYLTGLADFGSAYLVNDYMTSLSKTSYVTSIFKDFKKNLLYNLIYVAINLFAFVLFVLFCAVMLFYGIKVLSIFVFPLIIVVYVTLKALKRTYISQALPEVIVGRNEVGSAYSVCAKKMKGHFAKSYTTYVVATLINFYLQISGAVFTFGASLIFTIPFAKVFFINLQFIDYSLINGIKFYSDYDHVIVPKVLRENDETLLNGIDMD